MRSELILSAGMPRAGSGWHYNLIHDLVVARGGQDARSVRKKYHLQRFLTEVNCNISTLKPIRLLPVLIPSLLGNRYTIKTHAGPTSLTHSLINRDVMSVTYIFRDPRAAMLSAYEYGQRQKVKGRWNAFSHLNTLESAAEFIHFYVKIWERWVTMDDVLVVRYENLVSNFDLEVERLLDFLSLDPAREYYRQILDKYRPEMGDVKRKGTHFSKGQIERFRSEFTPLQLEKYSTMFQSSLESMGYPI